MQKFKKYFLDSVRPNKNFAYIFMHYSGKSSKCFRVLYEIGIIMENILLLSF